MDKRLETYFDENLRDVPKNAEGFRKYTKELQQRLNSNLEIKQKFQILGELGACHRILGDLEQAEEYLRSALQIAISNDFGIKYQTQTKIRLAHVLQSKKAFIESDRLFAEILQFCRSDSEAAFYLDFALQHAGKNFFDQKRWTEALSCFTEALKLRTDRYAPQDQIESTRLAIKRSIVLPGF